MRTAAGAKRRGRSRGARQLIKTRRLSAKKRCGGFGVEALSRGRALNAAAPARRDAVVDKPLKRLADLLLSNDHYIGPSGNYTTITNRAAAITLKNALDKYNNGGGC